MSRRNQGTRHERTKESVILKPKQDRQSKQEHGDASNAGVKPPPCQHPPPLPPFRKTFRARINLAPSSLQGIDPNLKMKKDEILTRPLTAGNTVASFTSTAAPDESKRVTPHIIISIPKGVLGVRQRKKLGFFTRSRSCDPKVLNSRCHRMQQRSPH